MNPTGNGQLERYRRRPHHSLTRHELEDWVWLEEEHLQELRQRLLVLSQTPINTPTGSPEWLDVNRHAS